MDIIENIKSALRAAASAGDKFDKFNVRSVARGANEQSFHFQCIIEDTVPVDYASVIAKNLDRLNASWTQIYLSSVGFIDLNYIKNPRQFVAKYQPKFRLESADEELEEIEDFVESCDPELEARLYGEQERLLSTVYGNGNRVIAYFGKGDPRALYGSRTIQKNMRPYLEGVNMNGGMWGKKVAPYMEASRAQTSLNNAIDSINVANGLRDANDTLRSMKDSRAPRLGEMDVKKINDMQPYPLELRLLASKGDSAFSEWINYTIGVKTELHLGSSAVLEKNLVYVLQNRSPLFNFIRWTTGELHFVRDLILHLDDINFDIVNKNDKTGRYIAAIKRMKKKYLKLTTTGLNMIAPMATIVISSATYENIKNSYGFDLKNMTFAKKIMEELFLMCFVIIDDVNHTVDLLVDGQADYQTYALSMLEREVELNSNRLSKELTRMLGSTM